MKAVPRWVGLRRLTRRALLAGGAGLVLGCQAGVGSQFEPAADEGEPAGPVHVAVAQAFGVSALETLIVAALQKAKRAGQFHPDTKISTFNAVRSKGNLISEALVELDAELPVDLVIFPHQDLSEMTAAGLLRPMSGLTSKAAYWPTLIDAMKGRDGVMAAPLLISPWMLMYNASVLERAAVEAPPERGWSWPEFREAVNRVNRSGPVGFHAVVPRRPDSSFLPPLYVWMLSAGVEFIADGRKPGSLKQGGAERAGQFVRKLVFHDDATTASGSGTRFGAGVQKLILNSHLGMLSLGVSAAQSTELWRFTDDPRGFDLSPFPFESKPVTPVEIEACLGVAAQSPRIQSAVAAAGAVARAILSLLYTGPRRDDLQSDGLARALSVAHAKALGRSLADGKTVNLDREQRWVVETQVGFPAVTSDNPPADYLDRAIASLRKRPGEG